MKMSLIWKSPSFNSIYAVASLDSELRFLVTNMKPHQQKHNVLTETEWTGIAGIFFRNHSIPAASTQRGVRSSEYVTCQQVRSPCATCRNARVGGRVFISSIRLVICPVSHNGRRHIRSRRRKRHPTWSRREGWQGRIADILVLELPWAWLVTRSGSSRRASEDGMASVQALSILPPGSVFANPRWPGQSSSRLAEATFRIVGNHVGGSSRPARNLDYTRSPKRHIARSSRSSDLASPSAPLVGLIGWTSQSGGFKSNFLFPIHVSSRVAENRLSSSFETRIQKPVFSRAAVSTKQENTVVTTEQGGGGGGMGGPNDGGGGGGRGGGDAVDWISSALIFSFWAGLLYYGAVLAPNQTSVIHLFIL